MPSKSPLPFLLFIDWRRIWQKSLGLGHRRATDRSTHFLTDRRLARKSFGFGSMALHDHRPSQHDGIRYVRHPWRSTSAEKVLDDFSSIHRRSCSRWDWSRGLFFCNVNESFHWTCNFEIGSVTLCITYISKATTAKERTTFIAINALVSTIGFIVGPGYNWFSITLSLRFYLAFLFNEQIKHSLFIVRFQSGAIGPHSDGNNGPTLEHVHNGWMVGGLVDFRSSRSLLSVHFPGVQHGGERGQLEQNDQSEKRGKSRYIYSVNSNSASRFALVYTKWL